MTSSNVIISSTGLDLRDNRDAAVETCLKLGLLPIAMEYFEAMGAGATDGSKRKVEKADVYVGIFAHRYGYIESGYDKSVTEIEFDHAGELKQERLCFLVDSKHPWPPDAIDYKHRDRLEAFKSRLSETLVRGQFTTVDDFKTRLMHALVEWKERHPSDSVTARQEVAPAFTPAKLAPPQPALLIGRETDLARLKGRFGINQGVKKQALTVIRGWPGVGKTTLVNALAHDSEVITAFPDGVLWAAVGESPNPLGELIAWARGLGAGDSGEQRSLEDVMNQVRALLRNRRVLLIVDDIWEAAAAVPFKVAGSGCCTLFTTRMADVARELATTPNDLYVLGQLDDQKALELLARLAPTMAEEHPAESRQLVSDLEGLPLAIRVAARLLEAEAQMGWGVQDLLAELSASSKLLAETAPDDRLDPRTGTIPTVSLLLKQSTDRLDEATRDRYAYLGAFAPKPATFDLDAMQAVWLADDLEDAKTTARNLADRGLLEPIIGTGRFQMHAVLVLHAKSLLEE
ncbi:MAG: hypothetical protein DME76_11320 [Verrucomicrobia bacterium]|nr:MAG: hypothetical protein DME76_11320 [Verrucomicrobiota bacterium]